MPSDTKGYEPTEYATPSTLFQSTVCERCALYDDCGGSSAAPCGCVWKDPKKQYDCENCHLICRSRVGGANPYHELVTEGRSLPEVTVEQDGASFPLLIPSRTVELPKGTEAELEWAAVTLRKLLGDRRGKGKLSGLFDSDDIREQLRVSRGTKLLAVLSGPDYQLEGLWGMDRAEVYKEVRGHGILGVTAPTFSIASEREGSPRTPASHNVLMLRRHHQVLAEIEQQTEALAVPNLCWRHHGDWGKWAEWLEENDQVHAISRDFSMTRQKEPFRHELAGLLKILDRVDRRFHVLVVGVGMEKARWTIRRLAEHGHTCSIVTSDPIYTAMVGGGRIVGLPSGAFEKRGDDTLPRPALALQNLRVSERYLLDIVSEIPMYESSHSSNGELLNEGKDSAPDGERKERSAAGREGDRAARDLNSSSAGRPTDGVRAESEDLE